MRKFVLPGAVVAAAIALLVLLLFGVSKQTSTSSIDAKVAKGTFPLVPDANASLTMLGSGRTTDLRRYRGKVVVLNVFASWCGPCASEAPLLAAEQAKLAGHDATLLGVSYNDAAPSTQKFVRRYHITYPVLRDVNGDFVRSFGTTGVPETFVIDRRGRIRALQRFPVTKQWLARTLPRILAERT